MTDTKHLLERLIVLRDLLRTRIDREVEAFMAELEEYEAGDDD